MPEGLISLAKHQSTVDEVVGHRVLSFLDAYSGYNQISMHPRNKEKTTFTTDGANYFYEVMSFGLKNAGATYQRMMDTIFKGMIGRSMEVYVTITSKTWKKSLTL